MAPPAFARSAALGLARAVATGVDPPPSPAWRPRWRALRWAARRVRVLLLLLSVALAAAAAADLASRQPGLGVITFGFGAAVVSPLWLLPRRPLWAWRVAWVLAVVFGLVSGEVDGTWPWHGVQTVVLLLTFLLVGTRQPASVVVWVWALSLGLVVFFRPSEQVGIALLFTALVLAGFLLGWRTRAQRRLAAEEERGTLLVERARIARELHDVVAHHMSLVAVRAESAPYRVAGMSDETRAELAEIARTARAGLTELRRLLGVLRSDDDPGLAPQPGLADVPELVERARAAGADIAFDATIAPAGHRSAGDVPGTADVPGSADVPGTADVPAAVAVSAYRIVQEALSNAGRHAPGAAVEVTVARTADAVEVAVVNAAPAVPAHVGPPGHGVRGMRERVAMLGGELTAAPTDDGGFAVRATLPVDARDTPRNTPRDAPRNTPRDPRPAPTEDAP